MITMEVFVEIRALNRQGLSVRAIARKLGIHRATVKKYLQEDAPPPCRQAGSRASKLDPYRGLVKTLLGEDTYQATWIYEKIKGLGYPGGYEQVKRCVRKIKGEYQQVAYIRFETEPGRQAQVDWGDFQIEEPDGTSTTIHAFCMLLGFSRAQYVEFVERCTLEAFLDAHMRAFEYLGGVPQEILYDRMKHVVTLAAPGQVVFNREFLSFAGHYGFRPRLCPAYSPWVKGKVERPIHYLREAFWRGYVFQGMEQANRDLRNWLDGTANRRIHGTHKQPISVRWEEDRAHLLALPPTAYDTWPTVSRKVYKDCQIRWEGVPYVVPDRTLAGKRVLVKVKGGRLRIIHDATRVAEYAVRRPDADRSSTPWVGGDDFYQGLLKDLVLRQRKYGRGKGKATRGLVNGTLMPEVTRRSLEEYDRLGRGGR